MTTAEPESGPAPALWHRGWYRYARALNSPNRGPRPDKARIDLIVVHSISLPPGDYGNANVQRLFTNQLDWDAHPYFQGIRGLQVSSHFFISRTGELWQFVSCDARAWHEQWSYETGANGGKQLHFINGLLASVDDFVPPGPYPQFVE